MQPVTATVANGATQTIALSATHGVTLTIRVADAAGLLAANPQIDDLLVGTGTGTSPFIAATVQSRDAAGKTLSLLVPNGRPGRFRFTAAP